MESEIFATGKLFFIIINILVYTAGYFTVCGNYILHIHVGR